MYDINKTNKNMQKKRLIIILVAVVVLLFIPLIAMQFSAEVNWTWFDFASMAVLLLGGGLLCDLVLRKVKTLKLRVLLCALLLVVFFLIWAELAVGIFATCMAGS